MAATRIMQTGPIGLDVGPRAVRAAQIFFGPRGARVTASASFDRAGPGGPLTDAEARRIARVLARRGFTGRRVVAAVPDEKLLACAFDAPPRGAPRQAMARIELSRASGVAPHALEVGCWPLPPGTRARDTEHVLAAGCSHADAAAFLDALEPTGLDVAALEPRPLASARACRAALAASGGVGVVVDIDWNGSCTTVVHQGVVVHQRLDPDTGLDAWRRALRLAVDLPDPLLEHLLLTSPAGGEGPWHRAGVHRVRADSFAHLAREVDLSIAYAMHRYPDAGVGVVLLCGPGSGVPGIADALRGPLETEVRVIGPGDAAAGLTDPALVAAVGLAAHGTETAP